MISFEIFTRVIKYIINILGENTNMELLKMEALKIL